MISFFSSLAGSTLVFKYWWFNCTVNISHKCEKVGACQPVQHKCWECDSEGSFRLTLEIHVHLNGIPETRGSFRHGVFKFSANEQLPWYFPVAFINCIQVHTKCIVGTNRLKWNQIIVYAEISEKYDVVCPYCRNSGLTAFTC